MTLSTREPEPVQYMLLCGGQIKRSGALPVSPSASLCCEMEISVHTVSRSKSYIHPGFLVDVKPWLIWRYGVRYEDFLLSFQEKAFLTTHCNIFTLDKMSNNSSGV